MQPLLETPENTDPPEAGEEPQSGGSMMNKTGSDFPRVSVRKYKVLCAEVEGCMQAAVGERGTNFPEQ